MGGTVNKNDALRIGRGIQNIERLTQKNTTGLNRPVRTKSGIPAKITKVGDFGLYDLIEQQINKEGDGFEDKEPVARIWDDSDEKLPQAFEINGTADLDVDLIVYIYRQSNDEVALNQWFFDSASNTGGTTVATDKSNTSIKGKIQFRNDIPFNANLQGPFDFEFMAPKQVGSLTDGNRAYGGNEDGVDNFSGIQRHYKWMWYKPSVTEGYLMPGTAAFKQSVSDEVGLQFLNQMWIRLDHRFDGQVTEIHHGLCAVDFFEQGGGEGKFSETPAGGVQGVVWTSATDGGTNTIKCEFDKTGHLRRLDNKYGSEDDYPTDVNIQQGTGTYPSSSSLYNTGIDQESNLVDENNVDTNAFNGPIGTLVYTAIGTNGTPLNIGFTVSTGFSVAAAATEFNGAGTGGNNDLMFWDLSKQLDGSDVTLTSLLLDKNRSSTSKITDVESVQLVTTIETTPVPDNASFDVKVELQHGIGGTQAQGTEFIRFNANGEYQIVVFLFLKADEAAFDPDDAATYLLTDFATVINKTTFSGNTVSFIFDFDSTDSGSDVCARAFLEFFNTLVNPQPLPDQIGFCDISNANNFDEDCQLIEGTTATSIFSFGASTYSPESLGGDVTIGGTLFREINPITIEYTIDKGGATTEFSDAFVTNSMKLFKGATEVKYSFGGTLIGGEENLAIIANQGAANTDGWAFTINFIEDSQVIDGQQYVGKVTTVGVSDNPATDEFSFNSSGAFPATDFFGERSEDLPFPWPDNFDGTDENSSSVGDTNWNKRWTAIDTDGTASITGGELKYFLDVPAVQSVLTNRNGGLLGGDFSITVSANVTNFADTNGLSQSFNLRVVDSGIFICQLNANRDKGNAGNFAMVSENTSGETTDLVAGGLNWSFKIERIDGTVTPFFDIGAGFVAGSRTENNSNVLQVELFASSRWTGGNLTFLIDDFTVKVDDHIGTSVDFFSPNQDRWNDNNSAGVAYQIASPAVNSLEQIIPASSGVDIIRLENLFAGGANPNITATTWKVESNFIDMIFAGSGTETCMIEVENVAVDTMQCGWRDNGTGGQKFFVNINSTEEVAEANATSSGKVTIERGDFIISDTFDGTGQNSGSVEDANWNAKYTSTINPGFMNIVSGTLKTSINLFNGAGINGNVAVSGDFSIELDWGNVVSANQGNDERFVQLNVNTSAGQFALTRNRNFNASTNFYRTDRPGGFNDTNTTDTSGTIKMVRSGNTITYLNGTTVIDTQTISNTVTTFGYSAQHPDTGTNTFSVDFTAFRFLDGPGGNDITIQRVLFSNDDVFKFAFDDSNSPVTGIAIETGTTLTTDFNCTYQDIDIQAPTGTQFTFDPSL